MNLLIGLLAPIALGARWFPNIYDALFKGVYNYYSFHPQSFREFFGYLYGQAYVPSYVLSIFFVFLPFQLIKDYRFNERKQGFSFLQKWGILLSIMTVYLMLFIPFRLENIMFLVATIGFTFFFNCLFYFGIDRYTEKR